MDVLFNDEPEDALTYGAGHFNTFFLYQRNKQSRTIKDLTMRSEM